MPDRLQEIRARLDALPTYSPWSMDPAAWAMVINAPADIAWLVAEVDALRERVAVLRAEVTDLEDIVRGAGGAGA
jgi:cell division protein FtsB